MFNFQKPKVLALHLLFWSLVFSPKFPLIKSIGFTAEAGMKLGLSILLLYAVGLINAFLLVPRFFKTGRFGWYAPAVILLTLSGAFLMRQIMADILPLDILSQHMPSFPWAPEKVNRPVELLLITSSHLQVLAILFVSLIHRVVAYYITKEKQAHQFREAQLQGELKLLRTQINPHFLFNTLNNLYALVQSEPALVEDLLLRFGDILRFVTYESHQEHIPLSQELAYIENYIHLQRVKDESFTDIRFHIEGDTDSIQLEPMLLIPFIENAFKHSYRENSQERWIHLSVLLQEDGLHARIENNLPEAPIPKNQAGGIGLGNVRQRLQLRYPDTHSLKTRSLPDRYQVELWLNPTASKPSL